MGEPRTCVFCDREIERNAPPEHVLPQWMRRLRPSNAQFVEQRNIVIAGEPPAPIAEMPPERSKVPTIKSYMVCHDCNGGWMSDLETRASPLLRSMLSGQPRSIGAEEQAFLATWAVKTDMAWQTTPQSFRGTPLADYRHLREHKLPPPNARVRVGRYVGTALPWAAHNSAHLGSNPERIDLEHDPEGHWAIMHIDKIVFEVFGSNDPTRLPSLHKPELSGPVMLDLWPSDEPRRWPPQAIINDKGMLAILGIDESQLPVVNPDGSL